MQALGHGHPAIPHGFKVGVGTLAAAALYERVLARDLNPDRYRRALSGVAIARGG